MLRQIPWLWIIAGVIVALVGTNWYIGRVNSSHPAIWAMTGGDAGRRNYTAQPLPQNPNLLWSYSLGDELLRQGRFGSTVILTHPVVWKDGTIYVGAGSKVHAVAPDGKKKWAWESRTPIISLALGRQGTLYALAEGTLYAMNPDGTMAWQQEIDVSLNDARPLVVGQAGVIYVTGRAYLTAVTSTGDRKWRFHGNDISSAPAELPNGKLAILLGNSLYLLSRDGDTLWNVPTTAPLTALGLSADAKRIYVVGRQRFVVDTEGHIVSQGATSDPLSPMVALGKEYMQDGLTRYDVRWQQPVWTNASLKTMVQSSLAVVDRDGNTALVTASPPTTHSREELMAPTAMRLLDAKGEQSWERKDVHPVGAPTPAGKGRLCSTGFVDGKDGLQLFCIGDQ